MTMRNFELRVYTLRSTEARDHSMNEIYPRHLNSFPWFGIKARGFWTAREEVKPQSFVLASYAEGEEPGEVVRRYMQSKEFAEDINDFDVSEIVNAIHAQSLRFSLLVGPTS
jgi:hypothetical protein